MPVSTVAGISWLRIDTTPQRARSTNLATVASFGITPRMAMSAVNRATTNATRTTAPTTEGTNLRRVSALAAAALPTTSTHTAASSNHQPAPPNST